MQETWVQSLDWEDHLEKEMATHFSVLAWGIPWTGEPGRLQSWDPQELDTTERLNPELNNEYVLQVSKDVSPCPLPAGPPVLRR